MSVTTTFSVTASQSDGIVGNTPSQKVISGLSYGGIIGQYLQSETIGVAAPTGLTAIGSTTGGTLAAGTYYYKVTALNGSGETTGSVEVNVTTTGSTSSVALTWNAATGATSYRIYRGTSSGSEDHYQTSATNSFTDTGATGTAGTVPGSNTTGSTWTPTLSQTPLQAFYLRNLSQTGTVTVTWTPTGGSSAVAQVLAPQGAIFFMQPSAVSGCGITALTLAVSAPGTTVEGIWGA